MKLLLGLIALLGAASAITNSTAPPAITKSPPLVTKSPLKGLCHYCQCPVPKEMTLNTVHCRNSGLNTMPEWDLGADDEVYLIMKFSFNHFNRITKDMIPHRPDVYQMFFDNNNISFIGSEAFCRLPELKYLTLSGNKLEKIRGDAFKSCNNIEMQLLTLDLSVNKLHSLDDDLFDDLHELRELNLDENEFVAIDTSTSTALNKLHKLTRLHIARNHLKELNDGLSTPIKTLDYLNIAGNKLDKVPNVLKYGKHLVELNINDNPVLMIKANNFAGLENLRVLNMSMMSELELIDQDSFEPLKSLSHWTCSYNFKLKYIHPDMFGSNQPQDLAHVDLSDNALTTLDKKVLGWWEGENLNMRNNPLFCDCHLVWLKFRQTDPELIKDVRCESGPPSIQDKLLIELPTATILCEAPPNNFHGASESYAIVAALISIGAFAIIIIAVAIVAILRTRGVGGGWTTVRYTKARDYDHY